MDRASFTTIGTLCHMRAATAVVGLALVASLLGVGVPAATAATTQSQTLRGDFGEVSIDITNPQVTSLRLRQPDGSLGKSLLSPPSAPGEGAAGGRWEGGYTYLDWEGVRYDSRGATPTVDRGSPPDGDATLHVRGIVPRSAQGDEGPVVEDWRFTVVGDALEWEITQTWRRDGEVSMSGTPALFLKRLLPKEQNCGSVQSSWSPCSGPPPAPDEASAGVTSTLWYDPDQLTIDGSATCPGYYIPFDPSHGPYVPDSVCQIVRPADSWAIFKLFTDSHEDTDVRLDVEGGSHLYRRGVSHAGGSEIGAVNEPNLRYARQAGDVDTTTLRISGTDKSSTGRQLQVDIPDAATQRSLADLYGSMFNGGVVNNHANFDMGNQSEGYDWIGGNLFRGVAFAAGVQQPTAVAQQPFDLQGAHRRHLDHVWSVVDESGYPRAYGWQPTPDTLLLATIATASYVIATGDLDSARRWMPAIERHLALFGSGIDDTGLFRAPSSHAPCYYDYVCWTIRVKYSTYYQAFLYKALSDAAELQDALGAPDMAQEYRQTAEGIKVGINEELWLPGSGTAGVVDGNTTWLPNPTGGWLPNGSSGGRYADWVDPEGVAHSVFMDIHQYPLIAFGIAPPERAREMLETADRRMAQLVEANGYTRECSLSALWPHRWDYYFSFGQYTNGGCLLASTYYEVVARARMGDVDGQFGAYALLQGYARLFDRTSFLGNNAATMQGEMAHGSNEPYLSDAVMTPAALVHGILGVEQSWDGLTADPRLPVGWDAASSTVQYKGALYDIHVRDGDVTIAPAAPQQPTSEEPGYRLLAPAAVGVSPGQHLDIDLLVRRVGDAPATSVSVEASVDGGLTVTQTSSEATFTPDGGRDATVRIGLAAPSDGAVPSTATLVVTVAGDQHEIPVQLDLPARLGRATASSTQPGFAPSGANNGDRDSSKWAAMGASENGWNDATTGVFPDWLRIDFTGPVVVGRVDLYTLDSAIFPAALWGIRDADIELLVDGSWQKMAEVRGNAVEGLLRRTFTPVVASAVRVVVMASNDQAFTGGASRVVELEAHPA